jgi:predicted methyltransferase
MRNGTLPLLLALATGCGGSTPAATTAPTPTDDAPPPSAAVDDATAHEEPAAPAGAALRAAIDGPQRTAEDRARDVYRHPAETLAFFGITPDQDVIELSPSGGWYTRILAPLLREHGSLTAAIPDGRYGEMFRELQTNDPALYGAVRLARLAPAEHAELGEPESADLVLTFRNTHGWISHGEDRAVYDAVFRVLRPGGIFGVVQHRDAEGATLDASRGYVPEAYVIQVAQEAGFELVERSEINANPRDTRDYENGVWALPPSLRGGDVDRDRFVAIGESDRMTLKFRKPAGAAD